MTPRDVVRTSPWLVRSSVGSLSLTSTRGWTRRSHISGPCYSSISAQVSDPLATPQSRTARRPMTKFRAAGVTSTHRPPWSPAEHRPARSPRPPPEPVADRHGAQDNGMSTDAHAVAQTGLATRRGVMTEGDALVKNQVSARRRRPGPRRCPRCGRWRSPARWWPPGGSRRRPLGPPAPCTTRRAASSGAASTTSRTGSRTSPAPAGTGCSGGGTRRRPCAARRPTWR